MSRFSQVTLHVDACAVRRDGALQASQVFLQETLVPNTWRIRRQVVVR